MGHLTRELNGLCRFAMRHFQKVLHEIVGFLRTLPELLPFFGKLRALPQPRDKLQGLLRPTVRVTGLTWLPFSTGRWCWHACKQGTPISRLHFMGGGFQIQGVVVSLRSSPSRSGGLITRIVLVLMYQ